MRVVFVAAIWLMAATGCDRPKAVTEQRSGPQHFETGVSSRRPPGKATPTAAVSRFVLGDGWGCAMVMYQRGSHWYCFRGGPKSTRVPWMEGHLGFFIDSDHLCEVDDSRLTALELFGGASPRRFWQPPSTFDKASDLLLSSLGATTFEDSGERHIDWQGVQEARQRPTTHLARTVDEFTCKVGMDGVGVFCAGTNSEGLFGTRSECIPARRARSRPLSKVRKAQAAAERRTCSKAFVEVKGTGGVSIDGLRRETNRERLAAFDFDFGPRGLCIVSRGVVRCVGAIPSPSLHIRVSDVQVSPGHDARACALGEDGRLYCWGEVYALAKAANQPIIVDIALPPDNSDNAAFDASGEWGYNCSIHHPCYAKRQLPPCPQTARAAEVPQWSQLLPNAGKLVGSRVSVRGALGVGPSVRTLAKCAGPDSSCCNRRKPRLSVDQVVSLLNFACEGDESRVCCDIATNTSVIATGLLKRADHGIGTETNEWVLDSAEICLD